ncbi:SAGA complex subunit spt20 [Colletotrichum liriopes]|uniref:SAGA complex subunit spt20 n=1 Tax=Colletotrichum liriopes TaxID=708192 RepID=A0AA37LTP3_9PEZI|nr:SAGA complex subunit spt20 [Colletotrichum liriopes]
MAPVVTAVQPPSVASKVKRPVPPGIQTNGANSIRSSPSPSMSTKKPPNSATTNGANPQSARPVNRTRREPSTQAGRISRNSAGLRSASLAADMASAQAVEPPPYIVTDEYILKKYSGNPPSLVVHMHPTHFRFDQQDGIFPYKSPMRLFLEHLRMRTVPHDLLEYFSQAGVPFYEGCLIIQVHDHKSVAQSKDIQRPTSASSKVVPSSIHNHNPYIVPSPYVPYPKESLGAHPDAGSAAQEDKKPKTAEEKDKESMPAPSLPGEGQKSRTPSKPKTFTVVLHPTPESLQADLLIKAATPRVTVDTRGNVDGTVPPSTPISMVPPTPTAGSMPPPAKKMKRERMELDGSNIHLAESQILLATNAPLFLEPTRDAEETIALLDVLAHPKHSDSPPQPKTRKRTVAEMAADEAAAADQERYMLILDERLSSTANGTQSGANGADKEGPAVVSTFEPRFERFKVIADIKREHDERKEQEKVKAAEAERKLAQEKQKQMQEQQAVIAAQRQAEAEKMRREHQMAQELKARQEQQQREQQRRALAAQAAASQAAQNNSQNASASMAQQQQANVSMPNGTSGGVASAVPAQARFSQASQPAVSSPVFLATRPTLAVFPCRTACLLAQASRAIRQAPPVCIMERPLCKERLVPVRQWQLRLV